jgi:ubiquinone/menaquinone biosynthesis C-methylase UbiE
MQQNTEVITQWTESAHYWEKHWDIIRDMFAPVTQALIKDAAITGCAVLDVATGPGEPALSIAELIGSEGKVVGTDPVPEMVEAARREGHRRGLHNATFEVAFAESLPFPANSFDAVVSRFGVMFFSSPVDSFREGLRVLKPGGRIAMAVWHFADRESPFTTSSRKSSKGMSIHLRQLRMCQTRSVLQILASCRPFSQKLVSLRHPNACCGSRFKHQFRFENFWTLRSETSEKLRTKIAVLSKQQIAALKREAIAALTAYSSDRGISFPAEVLIVSGGKEAS